LSVGLITLSDKGSKGEREDTTSVVLEEYLRSKFSISFIRKELIPDEMVMLENMLVDFCDTQKFDLILTNGSTGVSPRDIAPDVTLKVIEKGSQVLKRLCEWRALKRRQEPLCQGLCADLEREALL